MAASAGDRLCKSCRAVFLAAAVLLNEKVADEEVIIPTLVLAKMAGGSLGYDDLAKKREPDTGLGITNLMYKAEAEDYAGWELADVVEGVPLMRILPMTANPRTYPGTQILRSVRIQVLSRKIKPPAVREGYERVLAEQGVRWELNIQGSLDYDFTHGYLGIKVAAGGTLQRPARHFPPPVLVEGFYGAVLGSAQARTKKGFAHALDLYGRSVCRNPETLIMAFAAWHIGAEPRVKPRVKPSGEPRLGVPTQTQGRVASVINLSCSLQALDGNGQQKPYDLQFEASRRDRVDPLGEQSGQPAEDRFDVLAYRLAQELLPRRHRPFGVPLALGFEVQADFLQEVLVVVVGVGLVGTDDRAFRQVQVQFLEHLHVRLGARRQRELHRLARLGDHQMHPQAVKVAPLTRDVAAKRSSVLFWRIKSATANAYVVAGGHRKGVHRVGSFLGRCVA